MNKIPLLLILILLAAACKKDGFNEKPEEPGFIDENWLRIKLPDGGEALAVAGNIDDTLLVTTLYNTYMVTENGTKFTRTTTHLNTTPGLLVVKDTIFALNGSSYDASFKKHYASSPSFYTLDKGLSWHPDIRNRSSKLMQTGIVTDKKKITYELKYQAGSDQNGQGQNFVLKTGITKTENGQISPFEHPIKDHQPQNLYLDKDDRLYIPTGGSFNYAGVYMGPSALSPAYIYITKQPVSKWSGLMSWISFTSEEKTYVKTVFL